MVVTEDFGKYRRQPHSFPKALRVSHLMSLLLGCGPLQEIGYILLSPQAPFILSGLISGRLPNLHVLCVPGCS